MREADLHPERRAHQRQRVVDVVAVADEREHAAPQVAHPLVEREQVGQRLARVLADREAVDDRDRRPRGQLGDHLVGAGAGHDRVDEPLEVARDVAHGLAPAEHHALGQVDRVAAQLGHARLERDPGPERRLLEQHRERPPLEERPGMAARGAVLRLELHGPREHGTDLRRGQVRRADEIPPTQPRHALKVPARRAPRDPTRLARRSAATGDERAGRESKRPLRRAGVTWPTGRPA